MTVIAYSKGVMAADTQLSAFNQATRAQKLVRLPNGGVAGGCGLWSAAWAGLAYLAAGGQMDGEGERKAPDVADATLLIAQPDGSLWLVENRFPAFPLLDSVAAVGCGSDAALMALGLGLSAVEAVARVTHQDLLCGDPVQSMAVEPTHEYSGVTTYVPKEKTAPRRKARKARK